MKISERCMITLLPEQVWARVAAGEVIERPASAVKEAVENSLDGGARRVRVSLSDGGKSRIVVEDDGAGIPFAELPLAVAQHATSKLKTTDDLEAIFTLGYRGEALASIASVSALELRSRTENEGGGLIRVSEGAITEHTATSCALGTRVQIDNIFFNLPARRKFLKAALSELRRASNVLRDYALAWAGVSFSLSHDGKKIFSTDGGGDRARTIAQLWGGDARAVHSTSGNLSLECWHQHFPGRGRNEISAFVNGRAVHDPLIRSAVGSFGKELSGNWALFFTIDPSLTDVNIHPAKAEIRFRHTGEVFESVKRAADQLNAPHALSQSLPLGGRWRPQGDGGRATEGGREAPGGGARDSFHFRTSSRSENFFSRTADAEKFMPNFETKKAFDDEIVFSQGKNDEVLFRAQTNSGYLIFEDEESIILLDPHAAHERIMFEKIKRAQKFHTQSLFIPEPLPPTLSVEVSEHKENLCRLGFAFDEKNEIYITGVPDVLSGASPVQALRATLSAWDDNELLFARWASLACKRAVKLTARIEPEEARALWHDLLKCENPYNCPHGRPTILTMKNSEITKHFGRSEA